MKEFKENECSCQSCADMCRTSPCFPTPKEVEALIEEGFEDKLAPTRFIDVKTGKEYDLVAPIGVETEYEIGGLKVTLPRCVFFENEKCLLHNLCLKPLEGRLAEHNNTPQESLDLRLHVLEHWKLYNELKNWNKFAF